MVKKIGLVVLLAAISSVASAKDACKTKWFFGFPVEICTPGEGDHDGLPRRDRDSHLATAAPEMDPASAMAGLALVLGGLAVLRGRRSQT